MGHKEHRAKALKNVKCAVITVSDTRTEKEDESGRTIVELLKEGGHTPIYIGVVKDRPEDIKDKLIETLDIPDVQAVIIDGGSGVNKKDKTIQAVRPLMEKTLPGFGELFRMLSFKEIGSAAMMSRAMAGLVRDRPVFCIPGSVNACRLAVKELIVPELGHVVWEVSR